MFLSWKVLIFTTEDKDNSNLDHQLIKCKKHSSKILNIYNVEYIYIYNITIFFNYDRIKND